MQENLQQSAGAQVRDNEQPEVIVLEEGSPEYARSQQRLLSEWLTEIQNPTSKKQALARSYEIFQSVTGNKISPADVLREIIKDLRLEKDEANRLFRAVIIKTRKRLSKEKQRRNKPDVTRSVGISEHKTQNQHMFEVLIEILSGIDDPDQDTTGLVQEFNLAKRVIYLIAPKYVAYVDDSEPEYETEIEDTPIDRFFDKIRNKFGAQGAVIMSLLQIFGAAGGVPMVEGVFDDIAHEFEDVQMDEAEDGGGIVTPENDQSEADVIDVTDFTDVIDPIEIDLNTNDAGEFLLDEAITDPEVLAGQDLLPFMFNPPNLEDLYTLEEGGEFELDIYNGIAASELRVSAQLNPLANGNYVSPFQIGTREDMMHITDATWEDILRSLGDATLVNPFAGRGILSNNPFSNYMPGLYGNFFGGNHSGVDDVSRPGDPILTMTDGVVVAFGMGFPGNNTEGLGEDAVVIRSLQPIGYDSRDNPLYLYTVYGHGEAFEDDLVEVGNIIPAGTRILNVDNHGNSSGAHLHFETVVAPAGAIRSHSTRGAFSWQTGAGVMAVDPTGLIRALSGTGTNLTRIGETTVLERLEPREGVNLNTYNERPTMESWARNLSGSERSSFITGLAEVYGEDLVLSEDNYGFFVNRVSRFLGDADNATWVEFDRAIRLFILIYPEGVSEQNVTNNPYRDYIHRELEVRDRQSTYEFLVQIQTALEEGDEYEVGLTILQLANLPMPENLAASPLANWSARSASPDSSFREFVNDAENSGIRDLVAPEVEASAGVIENNLMTNVIQRLVNNLGPDEINSWSDVAERQRVVNIAIDLYRLAFPTGEIGQYRNTADPLLRWRSLRLQMLTGQLSGADNPLEFENFDISLVTIDDLAVELVAWRESTEPISVDDLTFDPEFADQAEEIWAMIQTWGASTNTANWMNETEGNIFAGTPGWRAIMAGLEYEMFTSGDYPSPNINAAQFTREDVIAFYNFRARAIGRALTLAQTIYPEGTPDWVDSTNVGQIPPTTNPHLARWQVILREIVNNEHTELTWEEVWQTFIAEDNIDAINNYSFTDLDIDSEQRFDGVFTYELIQGWRPDESFDNFRNRVRADGTTPTQFGLNQTQFDTLRELLGNEYWSDIIRGFMSGRHSLLRDQDLLSEIDIVEVEEFTIDRALDFARAVELAGAIDPEGNGLFTTDPIQVTLMLRARPAFVDEQVDFLQLYEDWQQMLSESSYNLDAIDENVNWIPHHISFMNAVINAEELGLQVPEELTFLQSVPGDMRNVIQIYENNHWSYADEQDMDVPRLPTQAELEERGVVIEEALAYYNTLFPSNEDTRGVTENYSQYWFQQEYFNLLNDTSATSDGWRVFFDRWEAYTDASLNDTLPEPVGITWVYGIEFSNIDDSTELGIDLAGQFGREGRLSADTFIENFLAETEIDPSDPNANQIYWNQVNNAVDLVEIASQIMYPGEDSPFNVYPQNSSRSVGLTAFYNNSNNLAIVLEDFFPYDIFPANWLVDNEGNQLLTYSELFDYWQEYLVTPEMAEITEVWVNGEASTTQIAQLEDGFATWMAEQGHIPNSE